MSLDLSLQDERQLLVSYALLTTVLGTDDRNGLQGLHRAMFPLLVTALKRTDNEIVTVDELDEQMQELFGMTFPQDVLRGMLRAAQRQDLLTRATEGKVTFLTVDRGALEAQPDVERESEELRRDHGDFISEFRHYSREQFGLVLDRETAETAVHTLLLERVDSVSTISDYRSVASEWTQTEDQGDAGFALSRFIEHEVAPGTELHDYFTRLARGSALAVALFYRGDQVDRLAQSMKGLEVYFDTPVLLSLFGYHKPEDQDAAEDVLKLVLDSGAQPCVFDHTCDEFRNVLMGAALDMRAAEHGQALESTMPVVETFVERVLDGNSPVSDWDRYVLDAERLPTMLAQRGFRTRNRRLSPLEGEDVEGLEKALRDHYARQSSSRLIQFDVDSVLKIQRLRRGRRPNSLGDARAVLVTTNPQLVRATNEHYGERHSADRIPVCYTTDTFANLLWLKHPLDLPDMPWRQVVTYVYASLYPGEALWKKYRAFLESLHERDDQITDADYFILRFSIGARQALMDDTLGRPEKLTLDSIAGILAKTRSTLNGELQAKLDAKEVALRQRESRIAELEDSVDLTERARAEAIRKADEMADAEPLRRLEIVQDTIALQCRRRARRERWLLEVATIVAMSGSVLASGAAAFGIGLPLPVGVALVVLSSLVSFVGFGNVRSGWTFATLERMRAQRLTNQRFRRLLERISRGPGA